MATTISVSKQSVAELLGTGKIKPFVIPEYQRPYAWGSEEVETLFYDIWDFAITKGGLIGKESYFMGCIVSYDNDNGEQEIIDGQQRITSLFLLLRAIYTKLTKGDDKNKEAAQNFIRQIEPAIWRVDNLTGKVNMKEILLTSKVVDNEGNEILRQLLETGVADKHATDNYSKNYLQFQQLYDEKCIKEPLQVYDFIHALLKQAILLPINADSQETALTIFSTLNNRGLPLSDADIFKAKIYNSLTLEEKDDFISKWKILEKEATDANESIQQLFYYYMFYLRAKENDTNSSTPGVRKYYLEKDKGRIKKEILDDLALVLNIWKVVNTNQDIPGELWDNNPKIRKALDTLTSYPNEFWKYPVIIYYLSYRTNVNFEEQFLCFLNKLASELMTRFILIPTINAVKADILKLDAKIIQSMHPDFGFRNIDTSMLAEKITVPHRNIVRMLLKCYAYNHQDELLPDNWQIEHILPQRWQTSFFPDTSEEEVNEKIEHIGNKTPFERKLNIIASNGYFQKKQEDYARSKIEVTRSLVASINSDWTLEHIQHRDEVVSKEILDYLKKVEESYEDVKHPKISEEPTDEERALLKKFMEKGWAQISVKTN